jgi:hypothetical protein
MKIFKFSALIPMIFKVSIVLAQAGLYTPTNLHPIVDILQGKIPADWNEISISRLLLNNPGSGIVRAYKTDDNRTVIVRLLEVQGLSGVKSWSYQYQVAGEVLARISADSNYEKLIKAINYSAQIKSIRIEVIGPYVKNGIIKIVVHSSEPMTAESVHEYLKSSDIAKHLTGIEPHPVAFLEDTQHGVIADPSQWYLNNMGGSLQDNTPARVDADIDGVAAMAIASDRRFKQKEVVIAVIDSGANVLHPAFKGSLWVNPNEVPGNNIDDDGNGLVDDINGWNFGEDSSNLSDFVNHGTSVAGIIAAKPTKSRMVSGISKNAKIIVLKVTRASTTDHYAILASLEYSYNLKVDVVNMSFTTGRSNKLDELIQESSTHGTILVAAAGNEAVDVGQTPVFPCAYHEVICVAATDGNDELATFSNFQTNGLVNNPIVVIAAPGVDIMAPTSDGGYGLVTGTSFATPMVASTIGMLRSARPDSADERIRLYVGADRLTSLRDKVSGPYHGKLQGNRLNALHSLILPVDMLDERSNYCNQKDHTGYPRWNNYPYANTGEPGIDGLSYEKAFTICSFKQLLNISPSESDKVFRIRQDISWSQYDGSGPDMIGATWPIRTKFTGQLHGDGHSLFNINKDLGNKQDWALFRDVGAGGSIVDLKVRQLRLIGGNDVAVIALKSEGIINFVEVEGIIKDSKNASGLVAKLSGSAKVVNSYFEGTLNPKESAGGLVYEMDGNSAVTASGFRGQINAGFSAGGIVMSAGKGSLINGVHAHAEITGKAQLSYGFSSSQGGIAASVHCGARIENAYVEGKIQGARAGGVAGFLENGKVNNTYSLAIVAPYPKSGGAVGQVEDDSIVGIGGQSSVYVCTGTQQPMARSTIVGTYFLDGVGSPTGAGGKGVSKYTLQQKQTFSGWDMISMWHLPVEATPRLRRVPRSLGHYFPAH